MALGGQVRSGASGSRGRERAEEGAGWQGGSCRGARIPPGHGSPEKVPLLEGDPDVVMVVSSPSVKMFPKGKSGSAGTVMKGKGTSGRTYKCKITAGKDITSYLVQRE